VDARGAERVEGAEVGSGADKGGPPESKLPWHRLPAEIVPLRIASGRFWLWALALCVVGAVVIVGSPFNGFIDFPQFWAAGRTAGTPDLLDPARHEAWQQANGIARLGFFPYPPGVAWLFVPFALFPLATGFWLSALAMVLLVAASGVLGARIFGLDRRIGLVAAFAWAPCLASAALGQNAPLGLFLVLLTIEGLRRDDGWLAGLGAGLLLYKPTLALPVLGLLLLRRRWMALAVAGGVAAGWYLAGVAAAAGDWSWPGHWWAGLGDYYSTDTAGNAGKAMSLPGLLGGHGVPAPVALALGAIVAAAAVPRLLRAPITEAGAGACLVGLAVSPHSLNYEAALLLPALMWSVGSTSGLREPARTWLLSAAYLIAPAYMVSAVIGLSPLAVITLAATVIWITGWGRLEPRPAPASNATVDSTARSEAAAHG
jgi:hypothetical protein